MIKLLSDTINQEAAAIYALHGLDPHGIKVGESFVLCDAGGGTVDLISYTIASLFPKLEIVEAAEGSGGLCGSTYLNRRFGEFLTKKLGKEEGWDAEVLAEAMERFDTVVCTTLYSIELNNSRWFRSKENISRRQYKKMGTAFQYQDLPTTPH